MWSDRTTGDIRSPGACRLLHIYVSCTQVQENMMRGGQRGRSVQGRRIQTRPVGSIDRSVNLNRALWVLAEEMRKLKA